jgi:GNAT superfamily N-acetyltransferase
LNFSVDGECELVFFGLTKELIGTGAGRYLMNFAIQTAWDRSIERFHLYTCSLDSPAALSFYARSGFTAIGRKIEVADDPRATLGWDETLAAHVPIIRP